MLVDDLQRDDGVNKRRYDQNGREKKALRLELEQPKADEVDREVDRGKDGVLHVEVCVVGLEDIVHEERVDREEHAQARNHNFSRQDVDPDTILYDKAPDE